MTIGLGTVQFGINYGISNNSGIPTNERIRSILSTAYDEGINLLDCAPAYGNAEQKLGELTQYKKKWRVVSKTPKLDSSQLDSEYNDLIIKSLNRTLHNFKRNQIYGLLIHDSDNLFTKTGKSIYRQLVKAKNKGVVEKIGVSIYTSEQIEQVLSNFDIDLIQLPINILDQRLVENELLTKLKSKNIEIHARSIFLQGLLTMPVDTLNNYFEPYKKVIEKFHNTALDLNMSSVELAVSYCSSLNEIDEIIVGVENVEQLKEVINATKIEIDPDEFLHLYCHDEGLVNPSVWNLS
jgi:aryl-alcohol dehydrogenase-like predicted oxidoreductase